MRRFLSTAIVACGVLAAAPARAQLCHPAADDAAGRDDPGPDLDMSTMSDADMAAMHKRAARPSWTTVTARADLEVDLATISSGGYDGFVPSVAIAWWRLEARVAAPVYHLEYRGVKSDGPGDVLFSLAATAIEVRHVRAGVTLAVTEPTGNQNLGLGMGDVMWMPGAWGAWSGGPWGAVASASYGRMAEMADASGGGHHHGPAYVGSLVNPMNHEELAGAVRGTYRATRELRLHVLASVATPIELDGTTRAYAAAGTHYLAGAWDLGVEAALPIAGDPFHARMAIDVARSF